MCEASDKLLLIGYPTKEGKPHTVMVPSALLSPGIIWCMAKLENDEYGNPHDWLWDFHDSKQGPAMFYFKTREDAAWFSLEMS